MCGISGYFSLSDKVPLKKYYSAHLKIAHRGPDDEGFLVAGEDKLEYLRGDDTISQFNHHRHINNNDRYALVLGHRRLSIIDLSASGHQPFNYKNLYLSFNGEIYNYLELREELKNEGFEFTTQTDTEVFLIAYYHWGSSAFSRFNGMWAAVIYDNNKKEMIFSRDRFGIKPLYYFLKDQTLLFGSEIRFIASFLPSLQANPGMIYDYVEYGYLNHTKETMFSQIMQLKPGSYATYSAEGFDEIPYWSLGPRDSEKVPPEKVRDLLFDSVKLRMRSDVEVGSLLSGGMDSSSIVCSISENKYADKMKTFTITFPEKELDYERKYVDDIIDKTGFENIQINLVPDIRLIDELLDIVEFPYRSLTVLAIYNIYKYVKEDTSVVVLLNGEGSDEIFGGYNFHYPYFLLALLQDFKLGQFINEFRAISRRAGLSRMSLAREVLKNFVRRTRLGKYIAKDNYFKINKKYFFPRFSEDAYENILMMNRDFSALPEYLLYGDRISMKFSLEVRVPFLDHRLVEHVSRVDREMKLKNGETKYILKKAMDGVLPDSVINRKDKKGFFTPHDLWLKTILSQQINTEFDEIRDQGLFDFIDSEEIYHSFKQHKEGDLPVKLWRLFCLSRWKKKWHIAG